ncbi:tRNA glutamyl-Q(34) synthetase GluQRS [Pseudoxanthomonas sp. J31]|uniref:tRNA glutamyl-Q(34) synthetase GluQRS n=1 Tax=Pseudoxanthomonas sp. J31 TaxID=935851 RepID=UPI00048B6D9C|nr:tRNA glutamyl-Q(34) synthetase GluQRS [Pseudoxanthomonas sp. J31]
MAQASQASDVPYRGRFAPSPTGPLHAGSLLAAFGSWLLARAAGGQWLVRIEDVDRPREVPGAAAAQLATLSAFGLESDLPVVRQSEREPLYRAALQRLLEAGLAFPCSCSRSDLAAAGGVHRRCVAAAPRPRPAVRLRVADGSQVAFEDGLQGRFAQDVDREVGDFVLLRADGFWAYQLAVVVDDAEQGVTDVVRGADLLDSTPRQILLQRALGLPTPRYLHLPLLLDASGHKLSKSSAALPVDPADPLPALRHCWTLLGQDPAPLRGEKRVDALLWRAISHFDRARLPARLHFHQPLTTTSPDMSE